MASPPKVVITLPAYNAERTLEKTVADIPDHVREELILVDDASPDNTAALARSLGIRVHVHAANRGYGGNQKTCYTLALEEDADIVVLLHPDYQYEPKAVPLLIAPILAGDADMTFGSRFAGLGDPRAGGMPWYRYWGNRITTVLQNLILGTRFTEMHSGMRAYTRDCLLSLPLLRYPDDFLFDAQLLIDAVTTGRRVVEVPIPTRYTKESSSIAMGPLIRYVLGGLVHSIKRAWVRGRRSERQPVSDAPNLDLGSASARKWIFRTIADYVTTGKDLIFLEENEHRWAGDATAQGWEMKERGALADVVISALPQETRERAIRLEEATQVLRPGGLFFGMGPLDAQEIDRRKIGAGLRIVEYFARSKIRPRRTPIAFIARRENGSFDS